MKQFITIVIGLLALVSCKEERQTKVLAPTVDSTEVVATNVDKAADAALQNIEQLYNTGRYLECLDSIKQLRKNFPTAIEARKRCIVLYQEANIGYSQKEIERMSAELKETERAISATADYTKGNLLRNKRDTLQARIQANRDIIKMAQETLANNEQLKKLKK